MPVRKLILAVALVAWASPSLAGTYVQTGGCKFSGYYGYVNCRTTWSEIPDPVRDPEQERLDAAERKRELEKWTGFCKPTFKADDFGVRRASYAQKGCEFGRTE